MNQDNDAGHGGGGNGIRNKGYAKIIRFLKEKNALGEFNIEPFLDYDVGMMPHVLAIFGKNYHMLNLLKPKDAHKPRFMRETYYPPLHFLYEIIRGWDVPTLFGFPSAERVRLKAEMDELRTKNQSLMNEVEMLRAEISRLTTNK